MLRLNLVFGTMHAQTLKIVHPMVQCRDARIYIYVASDTNF